ncbi:hypothetical protein [Paracoccus mutanolyticus]|nr:hypothetical protein [Paracoccus mutanolyticus]
MASVTFSELVLAGFMVNFITVAADLRSVALEERERLELGTSLDSI